MGCAALNCSNQSKQVRLFRFPTNPDRRKKWVKNCGRRNWKPTRSSQLCEGHFEVSQFELHRKDGFRKLKPNAVPTIFHIRNPPKVDFENIPNEPEPPTTRAATKKLADLLPVSKRKHATKGKRAIKKFSRAAEKIVPAGTIALTDEPNITMLDVSPEVEISEIVAFTDEPISSKSDVSPEVETSGSVDVVVPLMDDRPSFTVNDGDGIYCFYR